MCTIPLRPDAVPVPGYRLQRKLGEGAFGQVWLTDGPGQTSHAFKFVCLGGTTGSRELRALSWIKQIRHPHLLPVTALWLLNENGNVMSDEMLNPIHVEETTRGTIALQQPACLVVAMPLGDTSLGKLLAEKKANQETGINVHELIVYMEESAKGIDFLNAPRHDLGEGLVSIQHRDIKPDNILLLGGSAVICDFGVVRIVGQESTTATRMVGSPAYMAPECIDGSTAVPNCDQYSLAITYFELRTGHLPFPEHSGQMNVLLRHMDGQLNLDDLPEPERHVVARAAHRNPDERFASCREFAAALRHAVLTNAPRTLSPDISRPSQWPTAAACLAAIITVGIVAAIVFTRGHPTPPPEVATALNVPTTSGGDGEPPMGLDSGKMSGNHFQDSGRNTNSVQVPRDQDTTSPKAQSVLSAFSAADSHRPGDTWDANSLQMAFAWCPPGKIQKGSPATEPHRDQDYETQSPVAIPSGFWMGTAEVTQSQWKQLMQNEPWSEDPNVGTGDDHPATHVNWDDATRFCQELTKRDRNEKRLPEDWEYALPSEDEWEYACRAGQTAMYTFGLDSAELTEFAWYDGGNGNSGDSAQRVKRKRPNRWGLHDVHGNVSEWCREKFRNFPVVRGGSWKSAAQDLRCASRYLVALESSEKASHIGFRCALVPIRQNSLSTQR